MSYDTFSTEDQQAMDAAEAAAELASEREGFASDPDYRDAVRRSSGSYVDSPACKLLATRCACCATELTDAPSIERGVGPVCAKLHGFDDAQSDPDWTAAREALESATRVAVKDGTWERFVESVSAHFEHDARRAANTAVHRIAARQRGPEAVALIPLVRALGFTKMADRIAHRLHVRRTSAAAPAAPPAPIRIRYDRWRGQEKLVVKLPTYHEGAVADFKAIQGRYFDRGAGENWFPVAARAAVLHVLERHFTGHAAVGPKGDFVVGEHAPASSERGNLAAAA